METENNNNIQESRKLKNHALLFFILANISAIVGGLVTGYFGKANDMGGFAIIYFLPFTGIFYLIFLYYTFKFTSTISRNVWKGALLGVILVIATLMILSTFSFLPFVIWKSLYTGSPILIY